MRGTGPSAIRVQRRQFSPPQGSAPTSLGKTQSEILQSFTIHHEKDGVRWLKRLAVCGIRRS